MKIKKLDTCLLVPVFPQNQMKASLKVSFFNVKLSLIETLLNINITDNTLLPTLQNELQKNVACP